MSVHLICVQTYWAHWARHSGYHQFLTHLPEDIRISHLRVSRGAVTADELRGMEPFWFKPLARLAAGRVNPWSTQRDILTECRLVPQIRGALRDGAKVVVHFMDGEFGYNFLGHLRRFFGRPADHLRIIASYHHPVSILQQVLPYKERTRGLDLVLTVGTCQLPFFAFLPPGQVRFVPHGIDTDYFCPGIFPEFDQRVYALTVGHWLRDFDCLERVISGSPDNVVFRIVAAAQYIERFRGLRNVELYSGIDDAALLRLYQQSHIGLMPLLDSTANNGVLEMMACGMPIITTRVGSVSDYLPDRCAILLGGNDPDGIIRVLNRLSVSRDERLRLRQAVRDHVLTFDWQRIAHNMAEIYRSV